jgi:enoyl-CoA hydratase
MIERDETDGIVTLRLAHGKANALDVELLDALIQALAGAADARAVILTGTGTIFSAGVDLFRMVDEGEAYVRRFFPLLCDFIRALVGFPAPLVVAANGHAIAGGGVMVMAGDYRLMAEGNGRVGVPELMVGVPFPASALEVVRSAVPPHRLNALMYMGRTLQPAEALAWGLVDEVAPAETLMDRAREVAAHLAGIAPDAFRLNKAMLRAPVLERIAQSERLDAQALVLWLSIDTHARIRDYLARTVRR